MFSKSHDHAQTYIPENLRSENQRSTLSTPVLFLILADDYPLVIWQFAIENDDLQLIVPSR